MGGGNITSGLNAIFIRSILNYSQEHNDGTMSLNDFPYGFHTIVPSNTDRPPFKTSTGEEHWYGYLLHFGSYNYGWRYQLYFSCTMGADTDYNNIFYRCKINENDWTPWGRINISYT